MTLATEIINEMQERITDMKGHMEESNKATGDALMEISRISEELERIADELAKQYKENRAYLASLGIDE